MTCDRQRHHGGDHRARDAETGRVYDWPDPTLGEIASGTIRGAHIATSVIGAPQASPRTSATRRERRPRNTTRQPAGGMWALASYVGVVLAVIVLLCAPAVVIAVWRLLL